MAKRCDSQSSPPSLSPKSALLQVRTSLFSSSPDADAISAYTIFIAENIQAFIMAVTDCRTFIATRYLIFAELLVFLPLAMIRNLAKLSGTALVADAFILVGCEDFF
jgi:hypothetical protein